MAIALKDTQHPLELRTNRQRGFTLLELIIVVAILAILALVTVLALNPGELFSRTRDARRLADLRALFGAIQIAFSEDVDLDGPLTDSCVGESAPRVFISIPDSETPPSAPEGWSFQQVGAADLGRINGTGWVPVNLTAVPGGSPLATIPIDPVNDFSQGLYYTYTCSRNNGFALSANLLESARYTRGGDQDRTSTDGGRDPDMFELATDFDINPMAPALYWALDEGSGTIAKDSSRNSLDGTLFNNPVWQPSANCKAGACLLFTNSNGVTISDPCVFPLDLTRGVTVALWVRGSGPTWPQFFWEGMMGKRNGVICNYGINISGSAQLQWYFCNAGFQIVDIPASDISSDQWHYIVGTFYDTGDVEGNLYIDGTLQKTETFPAIDLLIDDNGLTLGATLPVGEYLDGSIDDFRIYSRALLPAEISARYKAFR